MTIGVDADTSVADAHAIADAVEARIAEHIGAAEVTVLGTAMLAGVGAGVFAGVEQAARALPQGRVVAPLLDHGERTLRRERWRSFVEASAAL